jgi:hypothetical protein
MMPGTESHAHFHTACAERVECSFDVCQEIHVRDILSGILCPEHSGN